MNSITVYCGSSTCLESHFHDAAVQVGEEIAKRKLQLVYGGGSIGLMGTIAKTASQHGAKVVGVITHKFVKLEQANEECDELIVVDSIQERRSKMIEHADAFLMLPGGIGTYEEFFEVLVGRQISDHTKPIGIVNVDGYFNPLVEMLKHGIEHGFMRDALMTLLFIDESPIAVLDHILSQEVTQPPPEDILPMHGNHKN